MWANVDCVCVVLCERMAQVLLAWTYLYAAWKFLHRKGTFTLPRRLSRRTDTFMCLFIEPGSRATAKFGRLKILRWKFGTRWVINVLKWVVTVVDLPINQPIKRRISAGNAPMWNKYDTNDTRASKVIKFLKLTLTVINQSIKKQRPKENAQKWNQLNFITKIFDCLLAVDCLIGQDELNFETNRAVNRF